MAGSSGYLTGTGRPGQAQGCTGLGGEAGGAGVGARSLEVVGERDPAPEDVGLDDDVPGRIGESIQKLF
jgi:hypothetical protein